MPAQGNPIERTNKSRVRARVQFMCPLSVDVDSSKVRTNFKID